MTETDADDSTALADDPSDEVGERLAGEATRYLREALDESGEDIEDEERVVELLSAEIPSESVERELDRRAAASGALAAVAGDDPTRLADQLPVLADELRLELERTTPDGMPDRRDSSRAIQDHLVSSIAHVIASDPTTVAGTDGFSTFLDALTDCLTDGTLRVAAKALFARADERPESLASAAGSIEELLAYPDIVVQAWSAGTLGRVAEEHPDAVAPTAGGLRGLLDHDDDTVQHNAVEALGVLVRTRPDAVVPAADALRTLLGHERAGIAHNTAGVLGQLAETHPDAVVPAIDELRDLCKHDDKAVRRIATGALARLAQERPEAVADG